MGEILIQAELTTELVMSVGLGVNDRKVHLSPLDISKVVIKIRII